MKKPLIIASILGILMASFSLKAEARPPRVMRSASPGLSRTVIAPNSGRGGYGRSSNYGRRGRYSNHSNYGRSGGTYSRERIIIDREQRGTCHNCGYPSRYYPSGYVRNGRSNYDSSPGRFYYP